MKKRYLSQKLHVALRSVLYVMWLDTWNPCIGKYKQEDESFTLSLMYTGSWKPVRALNEKQSFIVTTIPPRPVKDRGRTEGTRKEIGRQNYPWALRVFTHSFGICNEYTGLSALCPSHFSSIFDVKNLEGWAKPVNPSPRSSLRPCALCTSMGKGLFTSPHGT